MSHGEVNPYTSPSSTPTYSAYRRSRVAQGSALFSSICTIAVPGVVVFEAISGFRISPPFVDVLTVLLFAVSALAVLFGIVGFRSNRWRLALFGAVIGVGETALIYWIKFHPWIMRDFVYNCLL